MLVKQTGEVFGHDELMAKETAEHGKDNCQCGYEDVFEVHSFLSNICPFRRTTVWRRESRKTRFRKATFRLRLRAGSPDGTLWELNPLSLPGFGLEPRAVANRN
jgi:hypothetical protein